MGRLSADMRIREVFAFRHCEFCDAASWPMLSDVPFWQSREQLHLPSHSFTHLAHDVLLLLTITSILQEVKMSLSMLELTSLVLHGRIGDEVPSSRESTHGQQRFCFLGYYTLGLKLMVNTFRMDFR
jgi:hypothetical protein